MENIPKYTSYKVEVKLKLIPNILPYSEFIMCMSVYCRKTWVFLSLKVILHLFIELICDSYMINMFFKCKIKCNILFTLLQGCHNGLYVVNLS